MRIPNLKTLGAVATTDTLSWLTDQKLLPAPPKRQPQGQLSVNMEHPYTKGLRHCFVFNSTYATGHPGNFIDLVV